jgi:acetyl/propionyl-CoA carboxylase alpha subunit
MEEVRKGVEKAYQESAHSQPGRNRPSHHPDGEGTGAPAVAVYEKPDSESLFIRFADNAVPIGDGPRKDYLNIDRMIWAARKSARDAIHPGYGFLAENADFSEACEKAGIVFIAPRPGDPGPR